jgi:serine protease Do
MLRFLLFVFVVAVCVFGLYRWSERQAPQPIASNFTPATGPQLDYSDVHVLAAMEDEYTHLVQAVVPSVVSITATKRVPTAAVQDPFELFFGRRPRQPQRTEEMHSLGSGVIVSKEGHILTNYHVVEGVDAVSIRLSNGQEATARIIGVDPPTDIAVLKVDGLKVTPLAFADSDQVKVGQRVIAVGNPFGFDETVTQGIISAKGRAMEDSANDFFQTDAAINPGNSGGPLVDLRGQILGINSSIYTGSGPGSGSWQGLGFAIPSNTARRALEGIIKYGRVPHGYLGVRSPGKEMSARMGLPDIDGAYIIGVTPGSPAEKAGIRRGDIILSIGQHPIHNSTQLKNQIAGLFAGSKIIVGVERDNKTTALTAQVGDQPSDDQQAAQRPQPTPTTPPAAPPQPSLLAGVHVMEIPPDHAQDLPPHAHGVMVADIDPNTPASEALQQSDVIEEIDHVAIHSVPEYNQAINLLAGPSVLLSICRDRHRSFTVITAR